MSISPPSASIYVGAQITLAIVISNVYDLGAFQFTLAYDPNVVSVQGVTLGQFSGSSGRSFSTLGPDISATGTVSFGAFSLGSMPDGANGSGTLAYIQLQPVGAGTSPLRLSESQVASVSGETAPLATQDGTLIVTACLGDFDDNGSIDVADVQRVAYRWGTQHSQPLYGSIYDVNGDERIDIVDMQTVAYRWRKSCSASLDSVGTLNPKVVGISEPTALPQPSMVLQAPNQPLNVGDMFTTSISIDNAANLGSFEVTLRYDPEKIEVVEANSGSFLESTGRAVSKVGPIVDKSAGTVRLGAFSLGDNPPGPNGQGVIAGLTLRALAPGNTTLSVNSATVTTLNGDSQTVVGSSEATLVITDSTATGINILYPSSSEDSNLSPVDQSGDLP